VIVVVTEDGLSSRCRKKGEEGLRDSSVGEATTAIEKRARRE
jgi:hypothetical protein